MKKRNSRQLNVHKIEKQPHQHCQICTLSLKTHNRSTLFTLNHHLISRTINQTMQKPYFLSTINKILQRQPSRQSITYQQVQKNLVFQQYLNQYFTFLKTNQKISTLIIKHLPNVKANYMDFKIKNFLILNKYRVVNERPNLPYPLCMQFQKQTDSKMSSTKSAENKVLQQLDKQTRLKKTYKNKKIQQANEKDKKTLKQSRKSNEKFQIKVLTKGIEQMIQNIKDSRALEKFKKQIQKTSQFKYGILKSSDTLKKQAKKQIETKKLKLPDSGISNWNNMIKEKQFKRKVQNDMEKYFPDNKNQTKQLIKKKQLDKQQNLAQKKSKSKSKSKFQFRSQQRLQTNPDTFNDFEQYGLSIIRERKQKSKSKNKKFNKSRQHSKRSKECTQQFYMPKSRRLETEYVESESIRLHTGHSMLMKSKSSSRIPTEYDSGIIIKPTKSKSKPKYQHFLFTNPSKKQTKSNSISSQDSFTKQNFKKTKSKSKNKFLQLTSPNKLKNHK